MDDYRTCPDCNGERIIHNESECCGAPITWGDICTCCGEHTTESICSTCEGMGEIPVTEEYLADLKELAAEESYQLKYGK